VSRLQAMERAVVLILVPMICCLLAVGGVLAQSGGPYDLSWNTVDGGGYTFSTGGPYTLGGTIGQADTRLMFGGGYSLAGGFWSWGRIPFRIYLPLVLGDGP
jgi:hypothetical protein